MKGQSQHYLQSSSPTSPDANLHSSIHWIMRTGPEPTDQLRISYQFALLSYQGEVHSSHYLASSWRSQPPCRGHH